MFHASFSDIAIVSCGTLTLELNHFKGDRVSGRPAGFVYHTGAT